MGKQDDFLKPKNAANSQRRTWNPFSRRDSVRQVQQPAEQRDSRNPMLNPSPATRRPRAASPPPAYAENVTAASGPTLGSSPIYEQYQTGAHPAISAQEASTVEDPYAFLSTFDTIFLIDDSGSMAGRSWRETHAALAAIVPICISHDDDGIDVYFLNHKTGQAADQAKGAAGTGYRNVKKAKGASAPGEQMTVEDIFHPRNVSPRMGTPTGTRLNHILRPYLKHYEQEFRRTDDETCLKPLNIIVITDGVPSDEVEGVIIQAAKKLDAIEAPPYQVGIQFFQVGNECGAADALRKLDDELSGQVVGGVRDIVDTVTFDVDAGGNTPVLTADGILKTLLGSVVKRLDRKDSGLRGAPSTRRG
ncbi:hypothetical protein BJ170DRAFT_677665 [Xylariales sp. AK1849]|nr:hypothetical protein BJ170DRAFT_677665 [Xylariales sp. AK1849]